MLKELAYEKAIMEILKTDNPNLEEFYTINERIDNYTRKVIYDAFIPDRLILNAFDKDIIIAHRIVIEIKTGRVSDNYCQYFVNRAKENGFDAIVFIFTSQEYSPKRVKEISQDVKVFFIYKNDLIKNPIMKEIFNSYKKYLSQERNIIIENNFPLLEKTKTDLAFALGAGCSRDSNISDWETLSKALGYELLYKIIEDEESAYKRKLVTDELTDKIFGCYDKNSALDAIYNGFMELSSNNPDQYDYWQSIKSVLYMAYDSPIDAQKPLMNSIVSCIKRRGIDTVINYNFDSVLEQNYNPKYKSNSNEIKNSITQIGHCTINHVHGYIPYDYNSKDIVSNFIFIDKEYYDNMLSSNSFTNTTQEHVFNNKNVIFVGVSFVDSNMKEILRKRKSNGYKNIIFAILKLPEFGFNGTNNILMKNKYKLIQECYFNSLGVKILWVDSFEEIPGIIDTI